MSVEARPNLVAGLNTLRIVAAIWVAMSHGARLPAEDIFGTSSPLGKAMVAMNNATFNGVAAVMVFFVISGYIIHFQNVDRGRINVVAFLVRRLVRVILPLLAAKIIAEMMGSAYSAALEGVLWSLYCEIAFYLLYPFLFALIARGHMLAVHYAGAALLAVLALVNIESSYYWELSVPAQIGIGFFCWFLGCVMAEDRVRRRDVTDPGRSIWLWRAAAILLTVALKVPVTHGPIHIGYQTSHWIIAVFSVFWLNRELDFYNFRAPLRFLETCGAAAYSLYLVHNPVIAAFDLGNATRPLLLSGAAGWVASWMIMLAAIAVATIIFYFAIEKPSHLLARSLATRVERFLSTPLGRARAA